MKIGAIFTGGTIGSSVQADGFISVDKDNKKGNYKLLDKYYSLFDNERQTEFVTAEPYTILSENLDLDNVMMLYNCVFDMLEESVEGVIIMHGTDTIQYSAGFLWHMLGKIEKPVLLVSSAYVLEDARENGTDNFKLAVDYIRQCANPGVFVSYMNSDGRKMIHRADKVLAHSASDSDLFSIRGEYYAEEIDGIITLNTNKKITSEILLEKTDKFDGPFKKIIFMKSYPEMFKVVDSNLLANYIASNYDALLIEGYHSGTVSIKDSTGFLCREITEMGGKVYLVGISSDVAQYETVKEYENYDINPLFDEAPISAFCRLSCE